MTFMDGFIILVLVSQKVIHSLKIITIYTFQPIQQKKIKKCKQLSNLSTMGIVQLRIIILKEMSLVQEYLNCYLSLSDPKSSKQANRRLLEIENSVEAWSIAEALIVDSQSQRRIHGCQLLSKKLSNALPAEIAPGAIANFVYSQPQKSKLHWLCIAKSVLHMNSTTPLQLQILTSDEERLALLRQMPTAIIQTRPKVPIQVTNLRIQYFQSNKEMLLSIYDKRSAMVIDVIECFIYDGVRLKSEPLLMKLLHDDVEEIAGVLETIFRHQSYPNLLNDILTFLKRVQGNQDFFHVYIYFYRNHYKYLDNQQFSQMINFVIRNLGIKDEADFAESYYFWYDLLMDHQNNRLSPQQKAMFEEALIILWRLVCSKCLLKQLPQHKKIPESSLSLDVDDDGGVKLQEPIQSNRQAQKFRQFAGDFLNLCITAFGEHSLFVQQANANLQELAKNSLLELQLTIYILSTLSEIAPQTTKHSQNAVSAVLKRQQELNEYLCGRVIALIGKLNSLFTQSRQILSPCLSFLLKCLQYESLAPPASQSCCQLLEDTKVQTSFLLTEDLQMFLGHLYELYFIEDMAESTRQNLAKAMAVFILKFKGNPNSYSEYLHLFSQRIQKMGAEVRVLFLEAAIAAQFWVNVQDEQTYRPVFEDFLNIHANFILQNIFAAQDKQKFTKAINLLNYGLKTNAVASKIDTWIYLINQVMKRYVSPENPLPIVLTPIINLGKAVIHLKNDEVISKTSELISFWANSVIVLLGDINKPKIQFNISTNVVQLHFILLQIYQQREDLIQKSNYSAKNLLIYICNCIENSQVWEYDLFKTSLSYLTLAIKLGSPVQHILIVLFRNYKKFAETLWSSVEPLLFAAYKSSGTEPILNALLDIKSVLDSKNPLTDVLVNAFNKSQGKTIKNILLCLS